MYGYVQKLQIAHLISSKTINIVSYNNLASLPFDLRKVSRVNPLHIAYVFCSVDLCS